MNVLEEIKKTSRQLNKQNQLEALRLLQVMDYAQSHASDKTTWEFLDEDAHAWKDEEAKKQN